MGKARRSKAIGGLSALMNVAILENADEYRRKYMKLLSKLPAFMQHLHNSRGNGTPKKVSSSLAVQSEQFWLAIWSLDGDMFWVSREMNPQPN